MEANKKKKPVVAPQEKPAEQISVEEQMEEFMFLGLRLVKGVNRTQFEQTFGAPVESVYGEVLDKHVKNGLLTVDDTIRLTEKGLDVSNYVMADFLLS